MRKEYKGILFDCYIVHYNYKAHTSQKDLRVIQIDRIGSKDMHDA